MLQGGAQTDAYTIFTSRGGSGSVPGGGIGPASSEIGASPSDRQPACLSPGQGSATRKQLPHPDSTSGGQRAAVTLHDLTADRQSQSRALWLGRQRVPDLRELLEDGVDLVRRDADAAVLDLDDGVAVVAAVRTWTRPPTR